MPATDTATTATAAETRAAGSRLIGFIRGGGGAIVDKLFDPLNFITKDAANVFQADGAIRTRYTPGDSRAKMIVSNTVDGTSVAPAYSEIQLRGGSGDFDVATISGYNSFVNFAETGLIFSLRNSANAFGERMRLTGNGNLGIGTATPAASLHVKSSGEIARLETTTPRGSGNNYMRFTDPTGTAGFLGWTGSSNNLDILNSLNANLVFGVNGGSQWQLTAAGNFEPIADNARNLAAASARISNSYFVNSPTVTCDIRLKFYRAEPAPTADEHAAALECFEVFGFFQHLDAREREEDGGSPARWHFGPKAQAVWTIFASHGLAAPLGEDGLPPEGSVPPAFLCFDTWGEETAPVMAWWRPSDILGSNGEAIMVPCAEGEEGTEQRPTGETYVTREAGNIFGVRIDQLQSLMLVAINKQLLALTDRVAALEAA